MLTVLPASLWGQAEEAAVFSLIIQNLAQVGDESKHTVFLTSSESLNLFRYSTVTQVMFGL